jgi:O-glycosyl hydrolase
MVWEFYLAKNTIYHLIVVFFFPWSNWSSIIVTNDKIERRTSMKRTKIDGYFEIWFKKYTFILIFFNL